MATLQKIRNRAGLLIIVIGVALFAFIIGDGTRACAPLARSKENVALRIGDQKISLQDYQNRFNEIEKMQGDRMPDESRVYLNNQIAQDYITRYVMEQESDALGLRVTEDELLALVNGDGIQASPQAQQFFAQVGIDSSDKKAFTDFLLQVDPDQIAAQPAQNQGYLNLLRAAWENLSDQMYQTRLTEKYTALMSRSYAVNNLDAKYMSGAPSRDVAVVRQNSAMLLADSLVAISDSDVKAYYDTNKETYRYNRDRTMVNVISLQVRPSAEDFQSAETEMKEVREKLANTTDEDMIVRNYSASSASDVYLTADEIKQLGLGNAAESFATSANVGDVNTPAIENDAYTVVKLCGKKQGLSYMHLGLVQLDSVGVAKADELVAALKDGSKKFSDIVNEYSADPQAKENGGYFVFPNQRTQQLDSAFTETMATKMQLDELYSTPFGTPIKKEINGVTIIAKGLKAGPQVDKFQVAFVKVPVRFSEETYRQRYSSISDLLAMDAPFEDVMKAAREKGLMVNENVSVNPGTASLPSIPSSREVVRWALNNEKGEVSDKVTRCSKDYLVIAQVADRVEAGYTPFDMVKDQAKSQLMVEKRGAQAADQMATNKYSTLDQYAAAMNTTVDTISGISYLLQGQYSPVFNAQVMTAPMGQITQPFAAGYEVMVVQPLSQNDKPAGQSIESVKAQQRRANGYRLAQTSFGYLVDQVEVFDNRARLF